MTKEAKLQAAMRILPEWVGYDKEIKDVQLKASLKRELEKEEKIGKQSINLVNTFF